MKKTILVVLIVISGYLKAQNDSRLLRFPTIHNNDIVFMKSGDLYKASVNDGLAKKLTNHIGFEMFPRISPDGKHIAFTGQYDGNTEVYVMSIDGGEPRRLTYTATLNRDDLTDRMGPNNIVMAWTPDSKSIIYRSRRYSYNSFRGQLFKVSIEGGISDEVPIMDGGFCSFSADGSKLAFNRIFREFRTWKYYKGGMADDIWVFDSKLQSSKKLIQNSAQDIIPMWIGDEIYFLSDRDRTMNLFSYNLTSGATTKVTHFDNYDIKFPSANGASIVYENEGCIYVFNTQTKENTKVPIYISDDNLYSRNEIKDASKNITSYSLSPDGNRVLYSARGDVFSVPAKEGVTYNLTHSSFANDRNAVWSPDGENIAFVSDKSGEFEIYVQAADKSSEAVQITNNADTYYFEIKWSPDSKKIMWGDKLFRLRYVDVETKDIQLVAQSDMWEIRDFNWSNDNKWITYSEYSSESNMRVVKVFNIEQKKSFNITQGWYDANSPIFSDDNKYLIFASSRTFNPIYNNLEWNVAYSNMEKIYILLLNSDIPSPLEPKNDMVKGDDKIDDNDKKDEISIDFDGISSRIIELPVNPSNYGNFYCFDNKIYYSNYSSITKERAILKYDLKEKKETILLKKAEFQISANRKQMLVKKDKKYSIINKFDKPIKTDKNLNLSCMKVMVDLKQEWKQIFDESWRQMRDFFYVSNMHGVDWNAMKQKYEALLPYVNHRADLTYIIGEMIGELNVGHAYSGGGDFKKASKIKLGLLGAKFEKHKSGYFQIKQLLESANWNKTTKNPLREPGVKAVEGNFIISINGIETNTVNNIFELLVGQANKHIELEINNTPSKKGSWSEVIIPIADESNLYYYNWVQHNIDKVTKATNGQVGYIHIRDMGKTGLTDFMSNFYPQLNKKALIIDDRGNGGGNVSPMLIERLRREVTRSNMLRNSKQPTQTPRDMVVGPKILLINHYSASDGDLFPYSFKKHKLGKTVGTRTWGGVVGIRGPIPFVDGGVLYRPEFASYSSDSSDWIIEGIGVEPDVIIDNNPSDEYKGVDKQLEKAIQLILEELNNHQGIPDIPAAPDKSK